jgi:hypothetical protein
MALSRSVGDKMAGDARTPNLARVKHELSAKCMPKQGKPIHDYPKNSKIINTQTKIKININLDAKRKGEAALSKTRKVKQNH